MPYDHIAFGDEVTETVGNVAGRTNGHGYGEDDDIRKQYTGYDRDKESGLDFAQARYYNSKQGRFTSVDPLTASANVKNPQTFNRYSYVMNSPYKFTDPLGLLAQSITGTGENCAGMYGSNCFGYDEVGIEENQEQQADPPETSAEQDDTGTSATLNRKWFVREDGTRVSLSDEANKNLNKGAQAIRDNIVAAMSAVEALQRNPKDSTSISLSTSISGTGGGGGVSTSVTYSSKDKILLDLEIANDKVQLEMADTLEKEKFSTSNENFKGRTLGEVEDKSTRKTTGILGKTMKTGSPYNITFAQYARDRANVFARNRYNKVFSKREPRGEGILTSDRAIGSNRRYPKVFDKDY